MIKWRFTKLILGLMVLSFLFSQCRNTRKNVTEEVADIYVDESYKPLFETAIPTFESQIERGKIIPHYVSELDAIKAFKENKTKTICITRKFTKEETDYLRTKQVEFTTDQLGTDAVALIVNPENADSSYTLDEIKAILTGNDTIWRTSKKPIDIVFDQSNSANFYYIYNLINKAKLNSRVAALKSNAEVIDLVRKNKNVLGIIGTDWINDDRDSTLLSFRKGITVCSIAFNKYSEYFQPYPAYIFNDVYPMTRKFYVINKAPRIAVGSQFTRFLTGDRGQMLIYKSNLIPATMVAREIQIVQEK